MIDKNTFAITIATIAFTPIITILIVAITIISIMIMISTVDR